jgi:hypothetical protein
LTDLKTSRGFFITNFTTKENYVPKRAVRRHHAERIVNKYKKFYNFTWRTDQDDEREVERWAKATASRGSIGCGCWMCANPRKLEGPTMQERRFAESADQQEREVYEIDERDY